MTSRTIALCHEWLTAFGGSEQVARRLAEVLAVDDVFTFAADPALAKQLFGERPVQTSRIGRTAIARRHWRWLLPAMPSAWSRVDLSAYDVVVTSAHACVNAIRVRPGAAHISYCHTPMRYAWDWRMEAGRVPAPLRPAWPAIAAGLRRADRRRARRVTAFIANSRHVAERIAACYGRDAAVVYPPIDTDFWSPDPSVARERFFLFAGRLVAYKRPDVAIKAAELAGAALVVAGDGPELGRLRRIAGPNVSFIGAPGRPALRDLFRRCRALVNPGVEDFGMTMAEAQACGAPVIARAAGGAAEIVRHGRTGILYGDPSPETLGAVMGSFDPRSVDPDEARNSAGRFAVARFDEGILRAVDEVLAGAAPARARSPRQPRTRSDAVATPTGGR